MESAILFPSENLALTATVSLGAGAASASHPLANIRDGLVTLPFIANAAGAVRIVFDCGSAVQVDGMFLPMANIPGATADVKWQGHTSNSWGAPDVSVDVTIPAFASLGPDLLPLPDSPWANVIAEYPTAADRTKRWWSLSVPSLASALAIGELLFGALEVFDAFIQGSNQHSQRNAAIVKGTAFGDAFRYRYPVRRRRMEMTVGLDDEDSLHAMFLRLDDEVGTNADPFILVPDTTKNLGLLVRTDELPRHRIVEDKYEGTATYIEVNRGLPL